MVVGEANINNIMGGIENTGSVRLHNHKRKLKQRFDIIKKLGQGTYGKVQLGINKETGQEVAIKTIKKSKIFSEADLIRIRREIQIMSSVQHPNIIHIYEVFENREKMVLVMEYAAGGELYDYLSERKVLAEEEARRIFRQIATACYYCHKHKICHRDLKLENILLDENRNAKIADFGLSNVFDDHRFLSTYCGSPLYASPEIVKGTPYHGPEVDCWSLGVLLYTLVYGAMPFDGSNFKRMVKQISQGDYYEPKKPSPASPLIQEMLTVNPKHRGNIEKICAHWWVNEGYDDSCLEISEELANQTPVRLDVLLSLNPPPPQLEGENLVLPEEVPEQEMKMNEACIPARSQSVGSLMDISNPAERRIKDFLSPESKVTPKRKLDSGIINNVEEATGNRKEKIVKENTIADIATNVQDVKMADVPLAEADDMKSEQEMIDPSLQGAVCSEILEEVKANEAKKALKVKKTLSSTVNDKILEEINEQPSQENLSNENKENTEMNNKQVEPVKLEAKEEKAIKSPVKKKIIKKKVVEKKENSPEEKATEQIKESPIESPTKPMERRQSRIFEQAEKFQNMISNNSVENKTASPEKPKKIIIPGVSVGGFKKEFERKASLTNTSPPKLKTVASKKLIIDKQSSIETESESKVNDTPETLIDTPSSPPAAPAVLSSPKKIEKSLTNRSSPPKAKEGSPKKVIESELSQPKSPNDDERKAKLKNAVSIISNALDKEGARKSKSRPCIGRKPPVPFGASGRSASGSISMISPLSPPSDFRKSLKITSSDSRPVLCSTPELVKIQPETKQPENQTSSAEIVLKSATLPRRKSTKAEIQLDYPKAKPAAMEFKTEMAHQVQSPKSLNSQRSEVSFPVNNSTPNMGYRSVSLEPDTKSQKERIIPIAFEKQEDSSIHSPPPKPPVPRPFQTQKSTTTQRSNSLSRQSTQESDTETNLSGDPIKKSPREYIIPIAVEGGGYVTPRAGSLEPSETSSTITSSSRTSKFGKPRRMLSDRMDRMMNKSIFDREGSEDESSFPSLHRHSSFGKDSDTEGDARKDLFHMHRLRSSRPRKATVDHADSLSSGEEDDDDDGFEFLTAENLFSTLLSRVRDLTQRINVDDNRPGFPNSRLLSHFDHGTNFWNRMDSLGSTRNSNSSLGRQFSRERSVNSSSSIPWRRSVSRDLATDIDSILKDNGLPLRTSTLPRGDKTDSKENLNLSDLNLKKLKLTEEDALALSYLTPGLSRRIQKQLFASLPPSEARKITRTLSMRNDTEKEVQQDQRRSVDRISSTLPRRFSYDKRSSSQQNLHHDNTKQTENKINTNLSTKLYTRDLTSPLNDNYDPKKVEYVAKPRYYRTSSLKEPMDYKSKYHSYSLRSPDSSLSEISPIKDDNSYSQNCENSSSSSNGRFNASNNKLDSIKSEEEAKPVKKISRFLRSDFYDTPKEESIVLKEKKEREMETQKVLKEIRDKRIKNRINLRRERSLSKEKSVESDASTPKNEEEKPLANIKENKNEEDIIKCKDLVDALTNNDNANNNLKDTESLLKNVSDNIKNIESNVLINNTENVVEEAPKKERLSKIIRPKSYPTENGSKVDVKEKEKVQTDVKESKSASKFLKNKKTTSQAKSKDVDKSSTKSKFLQSIEKKFEKLRTFTNEDKAKEEKKSGVECAIKKLREQSVPRNVEHITESTLIKRAVSVEDFSNVKSKTLQPSRKSVTKILSLFKKYEDKDKTKEDDSQLRNGADPTVMLSNINESNIPTFNKTKPNASRDVKSPENVDTNQKERPKSLLIEKNKRYSGSRSDNILTQTETKSVESKLQKPSSRLPVNHFRRSLHLDMKNGADDVGNNNCNGSETLNNMKPDRKNLKLDFTQINKPTEDVNLNRISYTPDECSSLFSPGDETLSCDSWSVCSDFHHTQDLISPISPNGNTYDDNESVIDRIRRKSFYTRFNEKKKPRRSLVGNYKDLDLYKDYSQKTSNKYKSTSSSSSSSSNNDLSFYRRSSGYSSSGEGDNDYKPYVRNKLNNDYTNSIRYQTYNPRRTNIASLYSPGDRTPDDVSTGSYKKYSYNPSRLSSLNRASRSPSSDFQYIPHAHASNHSSITTSQDNRSVTEHAL